MKQPKSQHSPLTPKVKPAAVKDTPSDSTRPQSSDPTVVELLRQLVAQSKPAQSGGAVTQIVAKETKSPVMQVDPRKDEQPSANNNNLSADMIAQAIVKAQQQQVTAFVPNQADTSVVYQPSRFQASPFQQVQQPSPALYQYHLLVNEQELLRQQQQQRNNFLRMAMWSGY